MSTAKHPSKQKENQITERRFCESDLVRLPKPGKYNQGKNKYRARLEIGRDRATEAPVYRAFYGKTAKEARQKTYDFIRSELTRQAELTQVSGSLAWAIEQWLHTEKYGRIRQISYDRLECTYENQVKPYIGGLQLREVTKNDCRQILMANMEKGYSASTIRKVTQFLKEFFRFQAAEDPSLHNPMANLKYYTTDFIHDQQSAARQARESAREKQARGRKLSPWEQELADSTLQMEDREEIHVLSPEEIERIRNVAENGYVLRWTSKKGTPIQTRPQKLKQADFFLFMLNTGLRAGEARALKYSDVDFETRRMIISRSRSQTRKRDAAGNAIGGVNCVEGKPKTKSSCRVLYLSLAAAELLRRLHDEEPEGYDGYIANFDGKPLGDPPFRRRFNSLLTQAGVTHCGLHSLRHTFASRYYEYTNGNRKLVADYLGHSLSNITERIYVTTSDRFMEQSIRDFRI